jgi:hypothetical protein
MLQHHQDSISAEIYLAAQQIGGEGMGRESGTTSCMDNLEGNKFWCSAHVYAQFNPFVLH